MSELARYAEKIPRIKELADQGWNVFDIDMINESFGLDRYIEVTVIKNGKVKKKEKRKVKRIRMRRSEWEWLQAVADALFFGLEVPEYRGD